MFKRPSSGYAADSRKAARECEAADIIAQRAGLGGQGRTADGIIRAEARADRNVCMAVELRIASNVLGV